MSDLEKHPMSRKESKESLKRRFNELLESFWKDGNPLPEEPLPPLPKVPLTKDQMDSTKDPLDLLIEKEEKKAK